MANNTIVGFKRGLSSALPTGNNIIDGVFYLTTDTNRLYIGQTINDSVELVELNKSITVVSAVAQLPSTGVAQGQFYYATTENILCVYNGSSWTQINPDTDLNDKINTITFFPSVSGGVVTTTLTINSKTYDKTGAVVGDANGTNKTATFKIQGDGTQVVASTEGTGNNISIKLTGQIAVGLSESTSNGAATISLDGVGHNSSKNSVTIKKGTYTTITEDSGIKIDVDSSKMVTDVSVTGGSVVLEKGNGSYTTGASNALYYTIGSNTIYNQGSLPVYTKTEIDNRLQGLDALVFKGLLGIGQTNIALPTTNVEAGWTYKVATPGSYGGHNNCNVGDLLIATGTEGNDGKLSSITWELVPSGDDTVMYYTLERSGDSTGSQTIQLCQNDGNAVSNVQFIGGTGINLAGSTTNETTNHTITINHDTYTLSGTAPTVTTTNVNTPVTYTNQQANLTVLTGLTLSNGHVTSISGSNLTISDHTYKLSNASSLTTGQNPTIDYSRGSIDLQDAAGASVGKITSSSLYIGASGTGNKNASIDLIWGTF